MLAWDRRREPEKKSQDRPLEVGNSPGSHFCFCFFCHSKEDLDDALIWNTGQLYQIGLSQAKDGQTAKYGGAL
jgi:hypothetical protein